MVAMLDFTCESALAISVDILAPSWIMVPDCNTNFRNGFVALDNPYKVVLDDSLLHLDEKLNILAAIMAAILDSDDRIATPTSGMVLQPLITHTKWY